MKQRLDSSVVQRNLLPDLRTAQAWIVAGDVLVDGKVLRKPGTQIPVQAEITLRRPVERYASRGGLKLEAALARFPVTVEDKVVLDAGASTGGFTDCLLQHGARKVFAVDAGFGQLRGKLAGDPRVVNLERTNISDLEREQFTPPLDLCVFDLSYLSAQTAIPILAALFTGPVHMIGLVKPLFEGVPQSSMADPDALGPALLAVLESLTAHGLGARDAMPSPVLGTRGTVEFLVWMTSEPAETPAVVLYRRALSEARAAAAGRASP